MKSVAQIFAASLEVHCPECGEPQPSPENGSDIWTIQEVQDNQGHRVCVACDEPFDLHSVRKAQVFSPASERKP